MAWIRVADQQGDILAESDDPGEPRLTEETLQALLERRAQSVAETHLTPAGEVVVVALPFRFRFPDERPGLTGESPVVGRPKFKLAEVALYLHGTADVFRPLRRNLVVSMAAALALVAAMVVFALRFPSYLRGKELEQQLELARRVQQELLPRECPACEQLDFAAECVPAWEVGGDYYDVFPTRQGQIALVLGDVSGKGLSAALLIGVVHGAVCTASEVWNGMNHAELTRQVNELLCTRTAGNRFVTLFWAYYDPQQQALRYVNAGHLPPLLVRRGAKEITEVHRLESGGPVLGLLPEASYEPGEAALRADDLLVIYSDGVTEATNASGDEFGDERLWRTIQANAQRSARDLQQEILRQVKEFARREPLRDDLTLLVARVAQQAGAS
jgi:sigma-B regulation protein RsbU (phosphoserine phosphatase)